MYQLLSANRDQILCNSMSFEFPQESWTGKAGTNAANEFKREEP